MSRQKLTDGLWFNIYSKQDFQNAQNGRVNYGIYTKPGMYLQLNYRKKCPRGCCYDDVVELLHPDQVVDEVKEEILELAQLLNTARKYSLKEK